MGRLLPAGSILPFENGAIAVRTSTPQQPLEMPPPHALQQVSIISPFNFSVQNVRSYPAAPK